MNFKQLIKPAIVLFSLFIVFLVVWFIVMIYGKNIGEIFGKNPSASLIGNEVLPPEDPEIPQNLKPTRDWSVDDIEIGAKASVCAEISSTDKNRYLFKKNGNEKLPIASLTKLMTALVVLESESEDYSLEKATMISQKAVDQEGGQGLLTPGEILSIRNLLYIMLIESSNDAAYSLAEIEGIEQFVDSMNLKATELGLFDTNFKDIAGLSPDNYSTVEDLLKLTKYLLEEHPLVWEILSLDEFRLITPQRKFHHQLLSTNELLGVVPNIVGGKTGETVEAKGCLLLVLKNPENQNNMVYIVLGSDDRFGETQKLINWVSSAYKW